MLIYNDGNEVWSIFVRSGVPVLPLYLFCALWGETVDVSDESLIARVEEEGDNSYHGGLVQSLVDEKHLAQPLALSRCLIKGFFFFPSLDGSEFGGQRSFRKKPDEYDV